MRKCTLVILLLTTLAIPVTSFSQQWKEFADSAKSYADKRQPKEALPFYQKVKAALETDSASTDTFVQLLRNMGLAYFNVYEFNKALPYFDRAKTITEKLYGKDLRYASFLNILAATHTQLGNYLVVESMHLEARSIRSKQVATQPAPFAQSCNNLGFFYWTVGNYEKAEPLILEGKAIRERLAPLGQHPDYAISCTNLANLYRDLGQYEKAESLYLEAKNIRALLEPAKKHPLYASSCNILADLYNLKNDYLKAEPLYLEAKAIRSSDKNSSEYAETCNNLFAMYRDVGKYKEAEALGLEAKGIYEFLANPDDPNLTININNLADLYFKMGQLEKAGALFFQARALWEKQLGRKHPYYITNTYALARLFWVKGDTQKAEAYFTSASNGNFERINSVFQFTNEIEKNAYLKNISGSADEYFSFYYSKGNRANAGQPFQISLQNRNLILGSIQQLRSQMYSTADTVLQNRFEEWIFLKQSLGRLLSLTNNADPRVVTLEKTTNELEKELFRKSGGFKQLQLDVPDWKKVQTALKPDEAAIEFISFRYFNGNTWSDSTIYAALLLRKDKQPAFIPLFEKRALENLFINQDINEVYTLFEYRAHSFYDLVWKPLEKELSSVKKVFFSTAGQLHQVAFAAIPVSKTEVLGDRFQLVQLSSSMLLTKAKESQIKAKERIRLYGGVDYESRSNDDIASAVTAPLGADIEQAQMRSLTRGSTWNYLPGTDKEVRSIKSLAEKNAIQVDLRQGIDATEESVKSLHGRLSPVVLHIATHGFFFPDPKEDKRTNFQKSFDKSGMIFKKSDDPLMRSGLLLAGGNIAWKGKPFAGIDDGILTSYEVAGLYMPNTKLVVLSACETALGDVQGSEGVYGLQRAFKMAGVSHLIMSLWKVPDNETAEFMQLFYQKYFSGNSIQFAFSAAQKAMKQKYRSEPIKWAAWVLIS